MDHKKHLIFLLSERRAMRKAKKFNVHPITGRPLRAGDFLDVYPAGATEKQINDFSRRTGVLLSSSLEAWLEITNGASAFFGVPPTDRRSQIEQVWDDFPRFRERCWIPVARDSFGNFFVQIWNEMDGDIQPVLFVETIGDYISYAAASNMLHFAVFFLEAEIRSDNRWPFDRDFVLGRDPKLAAVRHKQFWDS